MKQGGQILWKSFWEELALVFTEVDPLLAINQRNFWLRVHTL